MGNKNQPTAELTAETIEEVLLTGDLSGLTSDQRLSYYQSLCSSVGLNPMTMPFEYIEFDGRLQLYAKKNCSDQLRKIYQISVTIVSREVTADHVYVVTAKAKLPGGRVDEDVGAICLKGLFGKTLANAYMIANTKAKRRVTLSICGLSMLDESEIDHVVRKVEAPKEKPKLIEAPSKLSGQLIDTAQAIKNLRSAIQAVGNKEKLRELRKNELDRQPELIKAAVRDAYNQKAASLKG